MIVQLKDGHSFELLSNSTEHELMILVDGSDAWRSVVDTFSDDNLSLLEIDDVKYTNRHMSEVRVYFDAPGGGVEVHIVLIPTEVQRMIDDRVAAYADKAAGYDILTGGESNG